MMEEKLIHQFTESLHKGFIDRFSVQKGKYKPKLLVNQPEKNETVLHSIIEELKLSSSFLFSVAFITESGLATLKSILYDLQLKGIKGRLLTSTFLQFNKPKIFYELMKLKNVDVRIANVEGFHSKGYIFQHPTHYSLIVGSSNLTSSALKQNQEWNVQLNSLENGEIVHHFLSQFESLWQDSTPLSLEWITDYEANYESPFKKGSVIKEELMSYGANPVKKALEINPNRMQEAALQSLSHMREKGIKRSLVISATGTGKTYLSAFDVRRFRPKRFLFIAHREQILQQARRDYMDLLAGDPKQYGLLSGKSKELDCPYLFSTIQSLSKDSVLNQFAQDHFDYIVIDEVHKAGAASYQKVMDYFTPKFLLGMTATPERTDDFNIYKLFDYNIAYEIRLQEALEENMLCPFHYFGVADFEFEGEVISDTSLLSQLVMEERIDHLVEKIHYYGFSGERVKGLIFCSRKQEAHQLSAALNRRGFRTHALTGEDRQEEREQQIARLENGQLDYILTVDIFNEGIDIPSINQIVMLRQTESSIIFIQQLGRGLRKHPSKDYVTIIDFIGNYKNNYLIPMALSGDHSHNKDKIRRKTKETTYIKGVSTVNFEEIARKRIFESINRTNLTTLTILRDAYLQLEQKIGRMPYLHDFIEHHSIDPQVIVDKYHNYYHFLQKLHKSLPALSSDELAVLTMLSAEVLNGKRKHELLLLQALLDQGHVTETNFINLLERDGCRVDQATLKSVRSVLDLSFFTKQNQKKYGQKPIVLYHEKSYRFHETIVQSLKEKSYFEDFIRDIIRTGLMKSQSFSCKKPLVLYEKYTRKDACKLLNWEKDESATIFGYKTKHGTCPIFITYHKADDIEASVRYEDELLSRELLRWFTRSNRTIASKEVDKIIHAREHEVHLHIFVKKDDDEGTDFYYLGEALPNKESVRERTMYNRKGEALPVVEMELQLCDAVDNSLYHYLIAE